MSNGLIAMLFLVCIVFPLIAGYLIDKWMTEEEAEDSALEGREKSND